MEIFQVLPLQGENIGTLKHPKKNVEPFIISNEKFKKFVERNTSNLFDPSIVKVESNDVMKDSYVLIDEYGRFLDCSGGGKVPSESILDVGLEQAARTLLGNDGRGFRRDMFLARGGYFPESWSKQK